MKELWQEYATGSKDETRHWSNTVVRFVQQSCALCILYNTTCMQILPQQNPVPQVSGRHSRHMEFLVENTPCSSWNRTKLCSNRGVVASCELVNELQCSRVSKMKQREAGGIRLVTNKCSHMRMCAQLLVTCESTHIRMYAPTQVQTHEPPYKNQS